MQGIYYSYIASYTSFFLTHTSKFPKQDISIAAAQGFNFATPTSKAYNIIIGYCNRDLIHKV